MSNRVLHGKGKPFPYRVVYANSPEVGESVRRCCAACRVGTPYN